MIVLNQKMNAFYPVQNQTSYSYIYSQINVYIYILIVNTDQMHVHMNIDKKIICFCISITVFQVRQNMIVVVDHNHIKHVKLFKCEDKLVLLVQ